MPLKTLIAYASKCGSTEEVAREIGAELSRNGAEVDVLPAGKVKEIRPYDFVVLGTAIRMGSPLKEAASFAAKFREDLRGKPVALFSVGLQMREDTPESREKARGFLKSLADLVGDPVSVAMFAGKIDPNRFGFFLRIFAKMEKTGIFNKGDWRDWDAIRCWAGELAKRKAERV